MSDPAGPNQDEIARLAEQASGGSASAAERLFPIVYDELRRLAQACLRSERPGHTLQATALVHEAFMKLVGQSAVTVKSKAQFMSLAAQAMRRILVDHARTRNRGKRGGGASAVSLSDAMAEYEHRAIDLEALDDALGQLEKFDPQKVRLVELRFFGGLTMEDAASLLGMSLRSAEREWTTVRAWLRERIKESAL